MKENIRNFAYMDPATFNYLVEKLEFVSIFYNESTYSQIPVYKQVYIILKKLTHMEMVLQ